MKILIAGADGEFRRHLLNRLAGRRHRLFTISQSANVAKSKKIMDYNFDLADEKLGLLFDNILPDCVIWLGAADGGYDFDAGGNAPSRYMAGLLNLLNVMADRGFKRLVYISCAEVYGDSTEPMDIKSLTISKGEEFCLEFNKLRDMECFIIRASDDSPEMPENSPAKEIAPKKRRGGGLYKRLSPILENIILFAILAGMQFAFHDGDRPQIYFMMLYIVIISMVHGLYQSILASVLAIGFLIYLQIYGGRDLMFILLDFNSMGQILVLYIVGMICGHSRNRMMMAEQKSEENLEAARDELTLIHQINDANAKIKQELDLRLINYDNSLAKIYDITQKLHTLQPNAVFFSAIEVVMNTMGAGDVCIYIITTSGGRRFCRLIAKTPNTARTHANSIEMPEMPDLAADMDADRIFVNRGLNPERPMMAAPIFSQRELVSVIMIWDMDFNALSLYNVNRFMVVGRLISGAIERAYQHMQSTRESRLLPGTEIYKNNAFIDILNAHKEAADKNTTAYKTVFATAPGLDTRQIAEKLQPQLRANDYMGENPENPAGLFALLTGLEGQSAGSVYSRLAKEGLQIKEVVL